MNIWQQFVRQGRKEHSATARLAAMACGALVFVVGVPAFLFWLSTAGTDWWRFKLSQELLIVCMVFAALGLFLALWTVWTQFHHARGTPFPNMPTKKLLSGKPYSICRNPMALGTLVFYFSTATFTMSFMSVLLVLLIAVSLLAYIKLVEEKEMALRFGDEYSRYKQGTPFMIPRLSLRRRMSGG